MILTPEQQERIREGSIGNEVDVPGLGYVIRRDESFDSESRWTTNFAVTFEYVDGGHWQFIACDPSTEMQDGMDAEDVDAYQVIAYDVTTTKYRKLTDDEQAVESVHQIEGPQ